MTRAQKRLHLLVWPLMGPLLASILLAAVLLRPGVPINESLPVMSEHEDTR